MRRLLPLLFCLLFPAGAAAKPLVADLSQYDIAIDSGFTGTRLILFGARQVAGDVVVVVRGPAKDYVLRRKDRVGGIWINRDSVEMQGIPDYYAVASSKPLDSILTPEMRRSLQIGIPSLPYLQAAEGLDGDDARDFTAAFIAQREGRRLYSDNAHAVSFMGDTLFKTTLPFPDTIPRGGYTAETYLIYNGEVVGMQSTPLHVAKTGLDAVMFEMAHEHPVFYGVLAVLLAVSAGWAASVAFRKL